MAAADLPDFEDIGAPDVLVNMEDVDVVEDALEDDLMVEKKDWDAA